MASLGSCTKITYRFDLHREAAARAAADRTGWAVLLPAAVAVAFMFHLQHQADTTATTTTHNDEIKLFFGYQRVFDWATCHGLCNLGVIKSAPESVAAEDQENARKFDAGTSSRWVADTKHHSLPATLGVATGTGVRFASKRCQVGPCGGEFWPKRAGGLEGPDTFVLECDAAWPRSGGRVAIRAIRPGQSQLRQRTCHACGIYPFIGPRGCTCVPSTFRLPIGIGAS
jgi:hypothetical protein